MTKPWYNRAVIRVDNLLTTVTIEIDSDGVTVTTESAFSDPRDVVSEYENKGVHVLKTKLLDGPCSASIKTWDSNRRRPLDFFRAQTSRLVRRITQKQAHSEMDKIVDDYARYNGR